ncbi:MAG: hypothetical protein H6Q90_2868 [Deltaproteobacteria bacterium]|nr:hypothetical protein [Deltaproteobacteria bacterium]
MRLAGTLAVLLLGSLGCSKKTQDGLPPATEWQSGDTTGDVTKPRAVTPPSGDPHAGMNINGMPGVAGGDQNDPHAGVPGAPPINGGRGMGGDPTVDVTQLGLSAPDKARPIDPSRRIKGVLKLNATTKDKLKPSGAIFLMVKRPNADGQPTGAPLAVDRVMWTKDGMSFELTEAQAMVAGTELTGDVLVMARFDQDSDAMTKQPGDVIAMTRVKIPADNVVLEFDTVLQ